MISSPIVLSDSEIAIKPVTDWKQQYTLEQGIAETIAWIRENMERYKTNIYNI